tara:strand:- start:30 stop:356 length:327 start_codon:yes stop_codon:yes gene_type:complete
MVSEKNWVIKLSDTVVKFRRGCYNYYNHIINMAEVTTSEILMQMMQLQSRVNDVERSIDRRLSHLEKRFEQFELDSRFKSDPVNDPLADLPGMSGGKPVSSFGKGMGL